MRYTIVTPTICRQSLLRLCRSIDEQTQSDWEHLVVIDTPKDRLSKNQQQIIASLPSRENRSYSYCTRRHNNYGHTCRHEIWERAQGDYIFYLDDDDYLADPDVLKELDCVTDPWAIFPVLRHGNIFLKLPPGTEKTGTGMFIHKKEIGRWPDLDLYEADGSFVEGMVQRYSYEVLNSRPLVVQPKSSCGVRNAESWFGGKVANLRARWIFYRYCVRTRRK